MSETAPQLNAQEMEELSALADGTLPAERRAAVEARVAASPELRRLLARQRRAVEAARIAVNEPLPESLRDAVAARVGEPGARRSRTRRMAPRLALGGAVAATAAVVLALALSGGPAGPSVADAARLAAQPAPGPPPAPLDHSRTKLAVAVDGAAFPRPSAVVRMAGCRRTPGPDRRPQRQGRYLREGRPTNRLRDRRRLRPAPPLECGCRRRATGSSIRRCAWMGAPR